MRIAFIVGSFPSLSETFILSQITGLIDAGHEVDIYASCREPETAAQPEVQAYRLLERTRYFDIPDGRARRLLRALRLLAAHPLALLPALSVRRHGRMALSLRPVFWLNAFLNQAPYDVIQCHFGNMGRIGAWLKRIGVSGKLMVTFHGYDVSGLLSREGPQAYRQLFTQADLLMPISSYWKQKLVQMGADPARIRIHRMGIDPDQFAYRARPLRRVGEARLITVARLVEKKGIADAIQAVAKILRRNPAWRLTYEIIGDGPLHADLEYLIEHLGLQDHVRLMGSQTSETVTERMLAADLLLLPSATAPNGDQEGIPVSLMEGMAARLPVISTYHSGIPELVQDGRSGVLVPERDIEALANRLEALMRSPERWREMGQAGRAFVEAYHNIHRLNEELQGIYLETLAGGEISEPVREHAGQAA